MPKSSWPEWWEWEIDTTLSHLLKRMLDRNFSETELRTKLEAATGYHEDHQPGRYVIRTRHDDKLWYVIVEPILEEEILIVVTAYQSEKL